MASAVRREEQLPLLAINTTPLIDVMLVLLIMFIITIPLQSHAVKLDLPTAPPPISDIHPVRNKLMVTAAGGIRWNGAPVSKQGLADRLDASQRMRPIPELHLQPEPAARYDLVDEVLAMTKRAGVQRMGFVGNEAYARF